MNQDPRSLNRKDGEFKTGEKKEEKIQGAPSQWTQNKFARQTSDVSPLITIHQPLKTPYPNPLIPSNLPVQALMSFLIIWTDNLDVEN